MSRMFTCNVSYWYCSCCRIVSFVAFIVFASVKFDKVIIIIIKIKSDYNYKVIPGGAKKMFPLFDSM